MSKQTAVQALIEWAMSLKDREQQCTDWIVIKSKAEELLLMEKEQIIVAYQSDRTPCSDEDAEQYYNETYGGYK
jgi:hypothetical protein